MGEKDEEETEGSAKRGGMTKSCQRGQERENAVSRERSDEVRGVGETEKINENHGLGVTRAILSGTYLTLYISYMQFLNLNLTSVASTIGVPA